MTTIVSGSSITFNDNTTQNTSAYGGGFAMRNRIINGGMVIDQRNAGASVTVLTTTGYTLDRWKTACDVSSKFSVQQNAGSVTPPDGFTNYLGVTSLSAYSVPAGEIYGLQHHIEGYNIADLGWGTANAKTVTLSFWVRSSLTGTFGGSFINASSNRSYPYTYTISAANTWEYKTITVAGDTSGTWNTTNGRGIVVIFSLGTGSTFSGTAGSWSGNNFQSATGATSVVGTNGATLYITGVQLEKGSTATSFDYRPYGQELALCQRYCVVYGREAVYNELSGTGFAWNTTTVDLPIILSPQMRTVPSISSSGNFQISDGASGYSITSFSVLSTQSSSLVLSIRATVSSGLTAFRPYRIESANSTASTFTISAEL